jgi:hypothetical protein
MNKKIILIATFSIMTAVAFSQTTSRGEKALADPKRAENSAKADVYILKHQISDSVQTPVTKETKTTIKRKRTIKRSSSQ